MGEWKTSKWTSTLIRMNASREFELTFEMRFFISKLGSIYGLPPSFFVDRSVLFSLSAKIDWVSWSVALMRSKRLENNCLSPNENHFRVAGCWAATFTVVDYSFHYFVCLCALLIDTESRARHSIDIQIFLSFRAIYFSIW